MRDVVIAPNWSKSNPYQRLLINSLESNGNKISIKDFPDSALPFLQLVKEPNSTRVLHIHWVSDLVAKLCWSSSSLKFFLKLFLLKLDLFLVKRKGIRIVWTIHNKLAHQNHNKEKEIKVRKILAKGVDQIIVHSEEAISVLSSLYGFDIQNKTTAIFHGNYDNCYPLASKSQEELRSQKNINAKHVFLFFGNIRPYKGVELLIDAYKSAEKSSSLLYIAGQIPDAEYRSNIEKRLTQQPDIFAQLAFIPDQELSDLLTLADVVVLPFADTLTSGTVILAMTFGKALILPESAKVFGCVPPEGALYFKDQEHLRKLIENIGESDTAAMGHANAQQASAMTWQAVGELTTRVYEG